MMIIGRRHFRIVPDEFMINLGVHRLAGHETVALDSGGLS
jgi:hypothetical protein